MGHQKLIDTLRKDGSERVIAIRNETETEAERIKRERTERINKLRNEFHRKEASLSLALAEEEILSAEKRAQGIMLSAESDLSERLFSLAGPLLSELRASGYQEIFLSLVKELPDAEWTYIKVKPDDSRMAGALFPNAVITPDNKITGGIEASRENGRQYIINTFEKRLERAWEEMLPLLMSEIYKEISGNGVSERNSG